VISSAEEKCFSRPTSSLGLDVALCRSFVFLNGRSLILWQRGSTIDVASHSWQSDKWPWSCRNDCYCLHCDHRSCADTPGSGMEELCQCFPHLWQKCWRSSWRLPCRHSRLEMVISWTSTPHIPRYYPRGYQASSFRVS
jgi:hypothetical protein